MPSEGEQMALSCVKRTNAVCAAGGAVSVGRLTGEWHQVAAVLRAGDANGDAAVTAGQLAPSCAHCLHDAAVSLHGTWLPE